MCVYYILLIFSILLIIILNCGVAGKWVWGKCYINGTRKFPTDVHMNWYTGFALPSSSIGACNL